MGKEVRRMIKLGDTVRDKITGFEGTVVAKTEWVYGCVRYGVQGTKLKEDGTIPDAQWLDQGQIEGIKKTRKKTGGPTPTPQRSPDPVR
jgi:hypothetical protein